MKKSVHPNRARAARTAARSGISVKALGSYPPAQRQAVLDGLNSGALALVTAPGNAQYIVVVDQPEVSQ